MNKVVTFIAVSIFVFVFAVCSYGQGNYVDSPPQTVTGQVSAKDWVGSMISVRWMQTQGIISYDEITIFVPDSAQITLHGKSIGLLEIQAGDMVKVDYINTSPGPLKALSITVMK